MLCHWCLCRHWCWCCCRCSHHHRFYFCHCFCCRWHHRCQALPRCIVLIAVVDDQLSASAVLFLLLSPLPFLLPLLFPLPPPPLFLLLPLLVDCCLCPPPSLLPPLSLPPPLPPFFCCPCCRCCHHRRHRCIAVIALAFVLHSPLVLSLRWLVVASFFASVAGIFATYLSFG